MILTCGACQSKFTLDSGLLGSTGKRVRCSDCGHSWFQTPDPDDLLSDIEATIAAQQADAQAHEQSDISIPEGVKPRPADERPFKTLRPAREPSGPALINGKTIKTLFVPVALTAVLAGLFLNFQGPIMRVWPQSLALYRVMGREGVLPGEGLVFDKVTARREGAAILIEGNIINLTQDERAVPMMRVSLNPIGGKPEEESTPLAQWLIEPPEHTIAGEGTLAFTARYDPPADAPAIPSDTQVTVRFVLNP